MTDREMLELAAKAAGINIVFFELRGRLACKKTEDWGPTNKWNPLEDDGDALRLAIGLNLIVHKKYAYTPTGKLFDETQRANTMAATRRAITRAAAEIGKGMK